MVDSSQGLGSLIAAPVEEESADVAERMAGIFSRLAQQLREARLLRRENELLREENEQLRQVLGGCIDACDRYLAPALDAVESPEDDDQTGARQALEEGRRLLARRRLTAHV